MNAITKVDMNTTANLPRDFVQVPPTPLDRVTFNTADDGMLAGYVAVIRQHMGNSQRFAWVELDNEPAGQFRGVPLADIISCDHFGRERREVAANQNGRRLYLGDYSGALDDALRLIGKPA